MRAKIKFSDGTTMIRKIQEFVFVFVPWGETGPGVPYYFYQVHPTSGREVRVYLQSRPDQKQNYYVYEEDKKGEVV